MRRADRYKVLIAIPSYHRASMLKDALTSIATNLVNRVPGVEFLVFCYVQDASDADKELLLPLVSHQVCLKFVGKQKCNIGKIMRTSVLLGLDQFPDVDAVIMSDDDVLVVNEHAGFGHAFRDALDHMFFKNIHVVSAKLGDLPYGWRRFPHEEDDVPFKERFIMINRRAKTGIKLPLGINDEEATALDVVLNPEIQEVSVGEDLFIFLKAVIAGLRVGLCEGLYDYWHLPHMDGLRELTSTEGGFLDQARDRFGVAVDETTKYTMVADRTGMSVQSKLRELFDWRRISAFLNPVRADVLDYIKANLFVDEDLYITRRNLFQMYRQQNVRLLTDWFSRQPTVSVTHQRSVLGHHLAILCGRTNQFELADVYVVQDHATLVALGDYLVAEKQTRPIFHASPECIPLSVGPFALVTIDGLVRSEYETLIELNRCMSIGGLVIGGIHEGTQFQAFGFESVLSTSKLLTIRKVADCPPFAEHQE